MVWRESARMYKNPMLIVNKLRLDLPPLQSFTDTTGIDKYYNKQTTDLDPIYVKFSFFK